MEPEFIFIGSQFEITCVNINDNIIYSGDIKGNIIKWDFETRRPKTKFRAHEKSILNVDYLKTNNQLVTHGRDGYIKFWILSENKFTEFNRTESNHYSFCKISISHSSDLEILTIPLDDNDHTIEIIEFPRDVVTHHVFAKPSSTLPITDYGMIMGICLMDIKIMLVAYESGYIVLFNRFKQVYSKSVASCVLCIACSYQCNQVVLGTPEKEIVVLKLIGCPIQDETRLSMEEFRRIPLINPGISSVVFRNDGKLFATTGWDGLIRLFSSKSHRQLVVLQWSINHVNGDFGDDDVSTGQSNRQLSVCFSNDNYLISGSDDLAICVWNVYRDEKM